MHAPNRIRSIQPSEPRSASLGRTGIPRTGQGPDGPGSMIGQWPRRRQKIRQAALHEPRGPRQSRGDRVHLTATPGESRYSTMGRHSSAWRTARNRWASGRPCGWWRHPGAADPRCGAVNCSGGRHRSLPQRSSRCSRQRRDGASSETDIFRTSGVIRCFLPGRMTPTVAVHVPRPRSGARPAAPPGQLAPAARSQRNQQPCSYTVDISATRQPPHSGVTPASLSTRIHLTWEFKASRRRPASQTHAWPVSVTMFRAFRARPGQ